MYSFVVPTLWAQAPTVDSQQVIVDAAQILPSCAGCVWPSPLKQVAATLWLSRCPSALHPRHLAAVGFDPVYGARPVKRAIQRELETPLAQAILRGQFEVGAA